MKTQLSSQYSHGDQSVQAVHHSSKHVRRLSELVCTHSVELERATQEVQGFRKNFKKLTQVWFGSRPNNKWHLKLPLQAEPFQTVVNCATWTWSINARSPFKKKEKKNPTWLVRCKVTAMFRGIMGTVPRCALMRTWHLQNGLEGAQVWCMTYQRFGLRESQDKRETLQLWSQKSPWKTRSVLYFPQDCLKKVSVAYVALCLQSYLLSACLSAENKVLLA